MAFLYEDENREHLPVNIVGKFTAPSISHTATLITTDPLIYECDCGMTFSVLEEAYQHVQDSVEAPSYEKLISGTVQDAVKYVKKFPEWYLECHDKKYRQRVVDVCRTVFVNLRPWAFRKWFCVNITTGKGGCIACFKRDCKTNPGIGQGQRDKAKQLRMNVAGLQYVSTMSHEIIKQHKKNMALYFPLGSEDGDYEEGGSCSEGEEREERIINRDAYELGDNFDPKLLNTPEEMPFDHKFAYDPYKGIYMCSCKMNFEDISQARKHVADANIVPSVEKFLKGDVKQGLKYACKFPMWYIPAERVEVRQRIHDIIDTFQTKAKRLPIMQHSWACYNLYQQVFGCQKCWENCKNNSRCFGNITKRQASIEKARGNTFKLHCDTTTHQRLHFSTPVESSGESDLDEPEYEINESLILTGGLPEECSYHDCQWTGRQWSCECGKTFTKYRVAKKHLLNNVSYDLADVLKLNCVNAQSEMKRYNDLYLNMGFDDQATDMCYLIKKFKYRQNYERFWWVSINFSKRLIGCSICWEFHKCQTKDPIINKTLSLDSCSVPSLNQHEKSTVHQSILTSLNFRKRRIEKKIEIHKRKKRRLCSGYKSGKCLECGWQTDVEINVTETQPSKLAITKIIKKVADEILISHLQENCGPRLLNSELGNQIREFQHPKSMKELKSIFTGRSTLLWENLEREADLPLAKSPTKPMSKLFAFGSPQKNKQELRTPSPLSPDSSDSEEPCGRRGRGRRNMFDSPNERKSRSRSRSPFASLPIQMPRRAKGYGLAKSEPYYRMAPPSPFASYGGKGGRRAPPVKPLKVEVQSETEESVSRIDPDAEIDSRWIQIGALHVALKTEWGFKHLWSKKKYQKLLREAQSTNLQTDVSLLAHRIIVSMLAEKKTDSVWKTLRDKASTQARRWMNAMKPQSQWLYQTVSVLWGTDKTWNKGQIVEIEGDEIGVSYVSDYTETLTASDTNFRFEAHAPQDWWIGKTLDIKWDGAHEWYEATIEELNGEEIVVRYADKSTEKLISSQQLSYFALDRVKQLFKKTEDIFVKLQNQIAQALSQKMIVDVNIKEEPVLKTEPVLPLISEKIPNEI